MILILCMWTLMPLALFVAHVTDISFLWEETVLDLWKMSVEKKKKKKSGDAWMGLSVYMMQMTSKAASHPLLHQVPREKGFALSVCSFWNPLAKFSQRDQRNRYYMHKVLQSFVKNVGAENRVMSNPTGQKGERHRISRYLWLVCLMLAGSSHVLRLAWLLAKVGEKRGL